MNTAVEDAIRSFPGWAEAELSIRVLDGGLISLLNLRSKSLITTLFFPSTSGFGGSLSNISEYSLITCLDSRSFFKWFSLQLKHIGTLQFKHSLLARNLSSHSSQNATGNSWSGASKGSII